MRSSGALVYTVNLLEPDAHLVDITLELSSDGRAPLELMMPIWSPGFYRVEAYAEQVQRFAAHTPEGTALAIERPAPNRWRIHVPDAASMIRVTYRLVCTSSTVTTNWIGTDFAILNGPATFITLADTIRRRHELVLQLPAHWDQVCTGLPAIAGSLPNRYYADDYDTLVDAPIVIGTPISATFVVNERRHDLVAVGDIAQWDGARMAHDLEQVVREHCRFWKGLPYQYYVFMLVFREGGGGLEHSNSTLVTAQPSRVATLAGYQALLSLVSHEFFHAFNVKRLRPREFNAVNYEVPPRTLSLWVAEGLTCYYTDLLLFRAGLRTLEWLLAMLSEKITQLQAAPGRLMQTLEQSSYDVWENSFSGLNPTDSTVSYYTKGHVVGWLLDAHIRHHTDGQASLDDVMRIAYTRYSSHGFTPEEFRATVAEVGGGSVANWLDHAVASTAELDYTPALAWFGLRFAIAEGEQQQTTWQLLIDAAAGQEHLARLHMWAFDKDVA
jgi:predicted metalloprotease with PDZ domain